MIRKITYILASILLLNTVQVWGWGVNTHSAITRNSVEGITLQSTYETKGNLAYFLGVFGLTGNMPENSCDLEGNFIQQANQFSDEFTEHLTGCTVTNLIAAGSVLEDTGSIWDIENARYLRHFFNPLTNTGLHEVPGSNTGPAENARNWAFNGGDANIDNDFSWVTLFDAFERGIIAPTSNERMAGKQRLFATLGYISHLVEDMSQPLHTRDDAHPVTAYLETYGTEHLTYNFLSNTTSPVRQAIDAQPMEYFSTFEEYFNNLASFSNGHFFSDDTIFDGNFPRPNDNDTDRREEVVTQEFQLSGVSWSGAEYTLQDVRRNFEVSNANLFPNGEIHNYNGFFDANSTFPRLAIVTNGLMGEDFTLNDPQSLIYNDNSHVLLPRAVSHVRGLLNYFFRGRIEATLMPGEVENQNMSFIELRVKNASSNDDFSNGTLGVHFETADGIMHEHVEFPLFSLAKNAEVDLVFPPVFIRSDNGNVVNLDDVVRIVASFDGTVGSERGVAATLVKQQWGEGGGGEQQQIQFVYPIEGLPGDTNCPANSGTPKRVEGDLSSWYSVVWSGTYNGSNRCKGTGGHPGVDIRVDSGTPVLAIGSGTVHKSYDSSSWGGLVVIKHTLPNETVWSVYAHLKQRNVSVGQTVSMGQQIGLSGGATSDPNHGTSTGPHLHFQIDKGDIFVSPYWPATGVGSVDTKIEANTYDPIKFIEDNSAGSSNPGGDTPTNPSPTSCSGDACNGLNPETTNCSNGATTVGGPNDIYANLNGVNQKVGTVELRWSSACQTNWSRVIRTDGGTGDYVMARVVRDDGVQQFREMPIAPMSEWTDGQTRIWSPMVYAPANCSAYAEGMIDFSFMSSEFVVASQSGCSVVLPPQDDPVLTCPSGEVEDCSGGCSPQNWVGDSICDDSLNCSAFSNDGGDCGTVPSGPNPVEGEYFSLVTQGFGINAHTLLENANVNMWTADSTDPDQQWIGYGSNNIQRYGTNLCLNAYNPASQSNVNLWTCDLNDPDQQWQYNYLDATRFQVQRIGTPYCLNAHTPSDWSNLNLFACDAQDPEQIFEKVGNTSTPVPVPAPTMVIGGSCGSGLVYDCALNCVDEGDVNSWQSDDYCDDGQYGLVLTCPEFNNDGGACDTGTTAPAPTMVIGGSCGSGLVYDCALNCVDEGDANSWQSDDYCDDGEYGLVLTCPEFNNDGGACDTSTPAPTPTVVIGGSCGSGLVYDCALNCVDEGDANSWQSDNYCDDGEYGLVLTCPEFNNDGGACDGSSTPTLNTVTLQEPLVSQISGGSGPGVYCFGTSSYWHQQSVGNNGSIWTQNHDSSHGIDNYCDYNFDLAASNWEVLVWIPPNNATTHNACYKVSDLWGTDNFVLVDQMNYYDEWVSLGVFAPNSIGQLTVTLTDLTFEGYASTKIGFDAIKVVPTNSPTQSKWECDLGGW